MFATWLCMPTKSAVESAQNGLRICSDGPRVCSDRLSALQT